MSWRGRAVEIKPCILIYGKPYISIVEAAKVMADHLATNYARRQYSKTSLNERRQIQTKAAELKKRAYPRFKRMLEKAMSEALT